MNVETMSKIFQLCEILELDIISENTTLDELENYREKQLKSLEAQKRRIEKQIDKLKEYDE